METYTGQLFDLGPDGLGFIAEAASDRIWAFHYPDSGGELASDVASFLRLEGEMVQFSVDGHRVATIARMQVTAR